MSDDVADTKIGSGAGSVGPTSGQDPSVGGLSDVGRVRELNEDNWRWERFSGDVALYAVADGMGGHDRGEVASQIAIETLFSATKERLAGLGQLDVSALREALRDAVQRANRAVVAAGDAQDSNMGTTLTCALVRGTDAVIGNVGDSRTYLLRGEKLRSISQDHSLVAYLVQLGELTAEEARTHPSGNILVRSIGSMPKVEVDVYHVALQPGDRLLCCSDGLWGEMSDADIRGILLENEDNQQACRALVERANEAGGRDNSTLVIVRF